MRQVTSRRSSRAALLAVLLLTGCTQSIAGSATQSDAALGILPTESEISAAVDSPLSTFGFQPFVGGVEILPDGYRTDSDASPIACVAVTDTAPRIVYEPLPVLEAARLSFFNWDPGVATSGADAAAVRMSTGDGARAAFDEFVGRWRQCDGSTVVKHLPGVTGADVDARVQDVDIAGPVMSATVRTGERAGGGTARYERSIGVRGDAIVEVSLAIPTDGPTVAAARDMATRAVEVMLDKVGRPN
ncbi:sensor domain-containing protein [Mycolicibacterium arabiense]|uniref:Sensor domain-containing protein n=1 Tax=Mycolicibacterium arabiense TaxID=1286181 RepID=A0A7I7S6R4_9MYCO|nr:sensor domain-containing protein [Mycolicibacterium arabiense]MCV7376537.1 sensor domain-containing protein [Mycolicibacterium arabiense]BBY52552.1 sensor domain-containing protein [Mycolicibacterium arabiense]